MNLGDSLGISIFSGTPTGVHRKSRLLPPFGVLGVGIAMILGDFYYADFNLSFAKFLWKIVVKVG